MLYRAYHFSIWFLLLFLHQIFHLKVMQLTTDSSTPSICWLPWHGDHWICNLEIFQSICLTPHMIITLSFRSFALKGCSWQPIPAYPCCCDWHNDGAVIFTSSSSFDWHADMLICWPIWVDMYIQTLTSTLNIRTLILLIFQDFFFQSFLSLLDCHFWTDWGRKSRLVPN